MFTTHLGKLEKQSFTATLVTYTRLGTTSSENSADLLLILVLPMPVKNKAVSGPHRGINWYHLVDKVKATS